MEKISVNVKLFLFLIVLPIEEHLIKQKERFALRKKWTIGLTSASLALVLAACSDPAEPVDGSNEKENSDLTLEQVFNKSVQAGEDLTSMEAVIQMNQNLTLPGEEMELTTESTIEMDMVLEPMALYQKVETTGDGMMQSDEAMTVESYLTDDGFFMYDFTTDQWNKLPKEMSDQIIQLSNSQNQPNEQLKALEPFKDDFTFEQDDSSYILTLNASGEKFSELLLDQTSEMMPDLGMGMSAEELFKDTTFEDVMYEIVIDKESFLPSRLDMDMTMIMTMEGESLEIEQQSETVYENFNTIDEITVPQEILDSAVETQ
ncbi:hypothetical protein KR50_31230 [Jeotgalibacillus campisalis]|uniref:Uncharacterized protein n=1 Tax=Jeotgalibacillus campisalis TaxID=220754 RepID=A0A0C2VM85_9BACL|nr:hypothetical protein KR50_31230 [Jeotgalibacillus campisalis]